MENKLKDILIIVYKFPPMGGIGTRRWAKFAKYLARSGYKVHVLTSFYKYQDINNWQKDIFHENIVIHNFKSFYPNWLIKSYQSKNLNKILRILTYILNKTIFYFDVAQYDTKRILLKAKQIINENNIKNVIASGHPVSINYTATYLKIDSPDLNLIQDFRDNWNDLNIYHYPSKKGLPFFKIKEDMAYKEFFTLYYSDVVINVSEDLTNRLINKNKQIKDKLITITNGFDKDDFNNIKSNSDNSNFIIVYTGTLFNGRSEAINLILDAIIDLNDDFINDNLKILVYSNYDFSRLNNKYAFLFNKNIFFNKFIEPTKVLEVISKCRYCLSINSPTANYAFGTKIFDYMGLNKKIIHISNKGILYDILERENQYVCEYNLEKMKNVLKELKNDFINNEDEASYNFEDFDVQNLVKKLENVFI